MKFGLPLAILISVVLACAISISFLFGFDPKQTATSFIESIQSGNLGRTIRHFGMICQCPVRGGWGSYLIYQSGEEPNLAFLMGHKFKVGEPVLVSRFETSTKAVAWRHPEEAVVNFRLEFPHDGYMPYLLPLPLAYGNNMTLKELEAFRQHPGEHLGQAMTLRLRSGLGADCMKPNVQTIDPEQRSQFQALDSNFGGQKNNGYLPGKKLDPQTEAGKLLEEAMKRAKTRYLLPKAAGKVIGDDGKPLSDEDVEKKLPQLRSITLALHIVRSGSMQNWGVFRFAFIQPTFSEDDDNKVVDLASSPVKKPHYEP